MGPEKPQRRIHITLMLVYVYAITPMPLQEKHCRDGFVFPEFVFTQRLMKGGFIWMESIGQDRPGPGQVLSLQEGEADE